MTAFALELLDLDASRAEWSALAERSGNVFATWEWHSTWWRHYGHGRRLLATAVRAPEGELQAILPLYLWRERPLRIVRFLGHGPGDELGPICAPEHRSAAAEALRQVLARERAKVFVGEQLHGDAGWAELLRAHTLTRAGSPVLRFGGRDWEELLRTRSSNLREQVRRKERRLFRDHDAAFRAGGNDLAADLDTLFALHGARWADGSGFGPDEAFQRDFAAAAAERGWTRFWFLDVDGAPRAAWYGFRFGGAESYYQAGRDPAWDRASPGFVLLVHTIREAVADGLDEYRFLRGGESFKYRFASDDPGLETVGLGRGIGVGALAAARIVRMLSKRYHQRGNGGGGRNQS